MKLFTRKFWKYAFERAVKAVAQTAVGMMSADYTGIDELPFKTVGSTAALAGALSVLTSLTLFKESVEVPTPADEPAVDLDATQQFPAVQR